MNRVLRDLRDLTNVCFSVKDMGSESLTLALGTLRGYLKCLSLSYGDDIMLYFTYVYDICKFGYSTKDAEKVYNHISDYIK